MQTRSLLTFDRSVTQHCSFTSDGLGDTNVHACTPLSPATASKRCTTDSKANVGEQQYVHM